MPEDLRKKASVLNSPSLLPWFFGLSLQTHTLAAGGPTPSGIHTGSDPGLLRLSWEFVLAPLMAQIPIPSLDWGGLPQLLPLCQSLCSPHTELQ